MLFVPFSQLAYFSSQRQQADFLGNLFLKVLFILYAQNVSYFHSTRAKFWVKYFMAAISKSAGKYGESYIATDCIKTIVQEGKH